MIGSKDLIQDPLVVTGTFFFNNLYVIILFDSNVDRRFITPTFKQLLNNESCKLDVQYEVQLANDQIESTTKILKNCLLTLNDHTFHINLIPIPIGMFDIIIGMHWLSHHHVEILCYEKVIRLTLTNAETLIIYGDNLGKSLKLISFTKAQKYYTRNTMLSWLTL